MENGLEELKNAVCKHLIKLGSCFKTTTHGIVTYLRETAVWQEGCE